MLFYNIPFWVDLVEPVDVGILAFSLLSLRISLNEFVLGRHTQLSLVQIVVVFHFQPLFDPAPCR